MDGAGRCRVAPRGFRVGSRSDPKFRRRKLAGISLDRRNSRTMIKIVPHPGQTYCQASTMPAWDALLRFNAGRGWVVAK